MYVKFFIVLFKNRINPSDPQWNYSSRKSEKTETFSMIFKLKYNSSAYHLNISPGSSINCTPESRNLRGELFFSLGEFNL